MSHHFRSDEAVLVTDPENRHGVILDVPPGVKAVDLEPVGYVATSPVRCSFCRQRQSHNRGFFAVLETGGLALCGHCCAEKIAGKETVEKIRREVKRREVEVVARRGIVRLAVGLAPIVEIIERDWVSVEKDVHRHVRRLRECFHDIKEPRMPKLSVASRGLKEIIDAASGGKSTLTDAKRKRVRALEMIVEGIDELREELWKLNPERVQLFVRVDSPVHGFRRTALHGRSLYLLNSPSWVDPRDCDSEMELHMQLPKISLPNPAPLIDAVEEARKSVE